MRAIVLLSVLVMLASAGAAAAQAPAPAPGAADPKSAPTPAPGAADPTPTPTPAPTPAPAPTAAELRKTCAAAMNADKSFADAIVALADEKAAQVRLAADLAQHEKAAEAISKNERHVIIAYAAMWVVAAAFLIFLWRRQQGLRLEISRLQRDLEAATKDGK
jgi:hypothetical protein